MPHLPLHRLSISPQGELGISTFSADQNYRHEAGSIPQEIIDAFAESAATGLTELARAEWSATCSTVPSEFGYWRDYSRRYFLALRRQQQRSNKLWVSPKEPDEEALEAYRRGVPPMPGSEYLSLPVLRALWQELDELTRKRVKASKNGLSAYLCQLDPGWNPVGRVTFHLAENKKKPDAPFAFMATFTEGETSAGQPSHLPLSAALKQSIAAGESDRLETLLEPVSQAAKSCPWVAEMLQSRQLFAPQAWGIAAAYQFLADVPRLEEAGVVVRVPNWWNASRPPRPVVQVNVGTDRPTLLSGDGKMKLSVHIALEGETLSEEEMESLLAAREGLVLLRGQWVQVDQEKLQSAMDHWENLQQQHVDGIDFLQGMRLLSGAGIADQAAEESVSAWTRCQPGPWLEETLRRLRNPDDEIKLDPQGRLQAKLRPYQADGVRWLWFADQLRLGVCLADDMGLGKTIQVLALLLQLKDAKQLEHGKRRRKSDSGPTAPALLIVPTSLLGNWQREAERFAPDLKCFVAHRSTADPSTMRQLADDPTRKLRGYDLVLTSYGTARKAKWLRDLAWRVLILDEAQAIKNPASSQTKAIKKVPAQSRITLTGTPVENHLGDLWSLFDFCVPGLLGSAQQFKRFANHKDEHERSKRLAAVRQLIQPYVLRRLKTDPSVIPDLPSKTEMRVDCGLSATQATLYRKAIDELEATLESANGMQRRGVVLSTLMQLKQICNHPALYLKQSEFEPKKSGKFAELESICQTVLEKQEKILVFSQFQSMCGPLDRFLATVFGQPGLLLTGKTSAGKRNKLVEQFQQPFGAPYFVISVKAGGTGLNLTQACHVVHFDRWWNPAVEDQATDRVFRIGQKQNVLVHKFVCRGTLEERIDDLIHSKRELSEKLLGDSGNLELTEMDDQQLMQFVALDLQAATKSFNE